MGEHNVKMTIKADNKGFTLIELLMVILLLAILTLIGITQFTNFSKDAKDNATRSNLQLLRRGIAAQNAQMRVRCNYINNSYPPLANISANDITSGASPCTTTQIPNAQDRYFVANGIPVNPWGAAQSNTVVQCTAGACADRSVQCVGGAARDGTEDGWCYDVATGDIWPNTMRNDGVGTAGTEYTF